MDERSVRYPAGPKGEGKTHRVGLTRHCLTSGLVQLPYALKDALPEGALLAHDLERDEPIEVAFVRPRRLEGLDVFFQHHELQVNDEIELRIAGGDVPDIQLTPKRRARPTPSDHADAASDDGTAKASEAHGRVRRTPSFWRSVHEDPAPTIRSPSPHEPAQEPSAPLNDVAPDTRLDALPAGETAAIPSTDARATGSVAHAALPPSDPDVVERFGSVTVRRLGAGAPARADVDRTVPSPTPAVEDDPPELVLGVDPDVALLASETIAEWQSTPASEVRPDAVDEAPVSEASTVARREVRVEAGALDDGTAAVDAAAADAAGSVDDAIVHQVSLFASADPRPGEARMRAPRAEPPRAEPARSEPARSTESPADTPRPAARPATVEPRPTSTRPTGTATTPSTPSASPSTAAATSVSSEAAQTEQRAREEELSRAGDLHSRIVRWLLAPETPVIVSIERVQEAFGLPQDVARDIVDGIVESPPPSLRLTRLRTDLLRVSRITVEHGA